MRKKIQRTVQGTTNANIQLPESLHEDMKKIRKYRHIREGADPKLCRIYREAVELFIKAPAQQRILKEFRDGENPGKKRTAAARVASSV